MRRAVPQIIIIKVVPPLQELVFFSHYLSSCVLYENTSGRSLNGPNSMEEKAEEEARCAGRGSRHSSFSSATTAGYDTDVGSTPRRSDMSTATATTSWASSAPTSVAASPRWGDDCDEDEFDDFDEGPGNSGGGGGGGGDGGAGSVLLGALPLNLSALRKK